jgi:tetratricopeptide (TPR) repeat protein
MNLEGDERMKHYSHYLYKICIISIITLSNLFGQNNQKDLANTLPSLTEKSFNSISERGINFGKVQKYYENILKRDSTNYDALTNLGVICHQADEEDKALEFFEKAVKFHPQKARAYHNLGILYSQIDRIDDAVFYLNRAAELDPQNPASLRQLGVIYLYKEMYQQSINQFDKALWRNINDIESRLGKSLAYWKIEEYDFALAEIYKMENLGIKFDRMELLLANIYYFKKKYNTAIKYAKADEVLNSKKPEGHYLLGLLYDLQGEKEKAKFEFDEAFKIFGQSRDMTLTFDIQTFLSEMVYMK